MSGHHWLPISLGTLKQPCPFVVRMRFRVFFLLVALVVASVAGVPAGDRQLDGASFRWCVPVELLDVCVRLTRDAGVPVGCVGGLDRVDCLRKVQNRQADYLMADPEDVYVASHFDNQDFVVVSELRTLEEPTAPYRYEGIMLVRAADNFRSLSDLRGKRSCHTGFGRNVGYKIPVARLQRAGVLKLPATDGSLSPVERELAGLSELFSASCLPGSYSTDAGVDRLLKGRYANLCERCEQPQRCGKDDRYAGYEGAIRCLVENGGDVAFSKTINVRKYFGLPVSPGAPANPPVNPSARLEDYAYLCEDGTTRPIGDGKPVCSWAQRPWQVVLGNGDLSGAGYRDLQRLGQQLRRYWTEPGDRVSEADRTAARKLWIDRNTPVHDREETVSPRDYLTRANYVEVIEREGRYGNQLRLCVTSEEERQKCELMRQAAYSRDIRPALRCVLKTVDACVTAVHDGTGADAVVLKRSTTKLKPLMWETFGDVMVAIADKTITSERLQHGPLAFDSTDERSVAAARQLTSKLPALQTVELGSAEGASAPIRIVRSNTLPSAGDEGKVLVCADLSFQPVTNAANCHLESSPTVDRAAGTVYVRPNGDEALQDSIVHAFSALSEAFGRGQPKEQVFRLFGPFRLQNGQLQHHLIFHDYAAGLTLSKQS